MTLTPFLPPPGLNSNDSTFAAEGQWQNGENVRFVDGRPETVGGVVEMSTATAVVRANKMLVYDASGTIKLAVAGDTLTIAAINAAATDITPAANWTSNSQHCLGMFGDVLLALVSGGRLFESSAGAQAVAVTNAPTQSTAMLVTPSRQVMLLGTKEEVSGTFNGRCIRWSNIEDRTDWTTTATNNAGEYILPGQEDIVGGCVLGDYILIWTEGALWLAQFVGDPAQTFIFERVAPIGLAKINTFAIYRQSVYWVSPDIGFHSYQAGGAAAQIPCPLRRSFIDNILGGNANSFACANSRYGEIWFGLGNPVDAGPNGAFVFCVEESLRAQRPVWYVATFFPLLGSNSAGAMVESSLPWGSSTYSEGAIVIGFNTSAGVKPYRWDCQLTQKGISGAFIQTADFYLDESQRRVAIRRFIPDFDEQGAAVNLTLTVRDRPMSAGATKGPYSIATTDTKKDFRVSGKIATAKFSVSTNARFRLGKPLFDVVPLGER